MSRILVKEEDRTKTAFATPTGLFQFTVMPFGLSGVPATFQRMMDSLVRGLELRLGCFNYGYAVWIKWNFPANDGQYG